MRWWVALAVGLALILSGGAASPVGARVVAGAPGAGPADSGAFAGHVDIGGGRSLYLECRGTGGPTVVLEAG
jgi:hypothetical protein